MGYRNWLAAVVVAAGIGCGAAYAADPVASTVEDLFVKKTDLAGKQVVIKGKVVKVNNGIMQRNFLHVQDGTGGEGTNDITVTSQQTAQVGDEVTITGNLAADVDFGAGYTYPLLIEEASIASLAK